MTSIVAWAGYVASVNIFATFTKKAYDDVSAFIASFKAELGATPARYFTERRARP